jgi:hypothetical protein
MFVQTSDSTMIGQSKSMGLLSASVVKIRQHMTLRCLFNMFDLSASLIGRKLTRYLCTLLSTTLQLSLYNLGDIGE